MFSNRRVYRMLSFDTLSNLLWKVDRKGVARRRNLEDIKDYENFNADKKYF